MMGAKAMGFWMFGGIHTGRRGALTEWQQKALSGERQLVRKARERVCVCERVRARQEAIRRKKGRNAATGGEAL